MSTHVAGRLPVFKCNDPMPGFPHDVGFQEAKSLLQKGIRQGKATTVHQISKSAHDLAFADPSEPRMDIWRNWCNRIKVTSFEDCGCCPAAVTHVLRTIGVDKINVSTDREAVSLAAAKLALIPHSRLGSWIRGTFCIPNPEIRNVVLDEFMSSGGNAEIRQACEASWNRSARATSTAINDIDGSGNLVKFVSTVIDFDRAMNFSTKAANEGWMHIMTKARGCKWYRDIESLSELYKMLKGNKEGPFVYALALVWMQFPDEFDESNSIALAVLNKEESELSLDGPLELPEHYIDRHTMIGRKRGNTTVDFATKGAVVVNAMGPFQEWERCYIVSKRVAESIEQNQKKSKRPQAVKVTGKASSEELHNEDGGQDEDSQASDLEDTKDMEYAA